MRKLLLSVLLCAALVMGLLPTAAFPMELGNTPEAVEKAPTSALEEQTVNEELLSEYGEQKNAPKAADPAAPVSYTHLTLPTSDLGQQHR